MMNTYLCKVSDKNGKILKLVRRGVSPETVQAGLQKDGYFPFSIILKPEKSDLQRNRIPKKTLLDFTALLSLLLDADLGIRDSLDIMKSVTKDTKIISLAAAMEKEMEKGASFSSCLGNFGPSLPPLYLSMVGISETTGDLKSVFGRLNIHLARQKKIREKLISSLVYPVIVLCTAAASMILIATFIIPRMTAMFTGLGTEIPYTVGSVLAFSRGIFTILIVLVPLVTLVSFMLFLAGRYNVRIKTVIDGIYLKIPFAGSFLADTQFLNILFSLGALTSCGIQLETALGETAANTPNSAIREALTRVHRKILTGTGLPEALFNEKIIPERISKWVAVGEKTGKMAEVFSQLSGFYENELEKKASGFMNLIEPALILFTGVIVFGIVILVIVPLYSSFGALLE